MADSSDTPRLDLTAPGPLLAYLAFGYVPQLQQPDPFAVIGGWDENPSAAAPSETFEDALVHGNERLRTSARELASNFAPGKTHVVLLSGGFDSRAVLGALLENVDARNIEACTYGWPGADEYELAAKVCRTAGVRHHLLDIRQVKWSTEGLLASVRHRSFPPSFALGARFFDHLIYSEYGPESAYWEGFLGDSVSGDHLPPQPSDTWEEALSTFIAANRVRYGVALTPASFDHRTVLPEAPLLPRESMEFSDQLDIALRQTCYISNRIPFDRDTRTLFSHPALARFLLGLPRRLREGQVVYREMLLRSFPELFAIQIEGQRDRSRRHSTQAVDGSGLLHKVRRLGRRLAEHKKSLRPNPMVGKEMRNNPSLRAVMSENIAELKERKIIDWVDVEAIWEDHLAGRAQHTRALRVLCSLEIALKFSKGR